MSNFATAKLQVINNKKAVVDVIIYLEGKDPFSIFSVLELTPHEDAYERGYSRAETMAAQHNARLDKYQRIEVVGPCFKVYYTSFGYPSDREFDNLEEAILYMTERGFSAVVKFNSHVLASYDIIGGVSIFSGD